MEVGRALYLHRACVKVIEAFGCSCNFRIVFAVEPAQWWVLFRNLLIVHGGVGGSTQLNSWSCTSQAARRNLTLPVQSLAGEARGLWQRRRWQTRAAFLALCWSGAFGTSSRKGALPQACATRTLFHLLTSWGWNTWGLFSNGENWSPERRQGKEKLRTNSGGM